MGDEALVNGSAFGVGLVVGEWVCTKGERGQIVAKSGLSY
jgi:hypothetical protein